MFNVTPTSDIISGVATDAYFLRTEETLEEMGENPDVVAEISADQFQDETFEVLAGVDNAAKLLSEASNEIVVESLPEGSLFNGGPVMRIRGPYLEFARYETSLLGFLSHASGIATAAYRSVQASDGDASVLSFGARHVHPSIAPLVERSSLIAGVDGFSHASAGKLLEREASGTMPHALMLCSGKGQQEKAWSAFNDAVDDDIPRIILCDTFTDEKDEVLRAVEELGDDIDGVRLDTTGSRRGDFKHIIKEVNWALEQVGRDDVDVFVSGGLGPDDISELKPFVDGFGIGSYISNADPVDFSLDIVELNGKSTSKRGKNEGEKFVCRIDDKHVIFSEDQYRRAEENKEREIRDINGDTFGMNKVRHARREMRKIVEDGQVLVDTSVERANRRLENEPNNLQGNNNE
jgi:nicotinate phosphoribosyltransferase